MGSISKDEQAVQVQLSDDIYRILIQKLSNDLGTIEMLACTSISMRILIHGEIKEKL